MITYRYIEINSIEITNKVTYAEIIQEFGKAYHTINITISNYVIPLNYIRNENIYLYVEVEELGFEFIIFDAETDAKNNTTIIAKTLGCLLDFPFSTIKDEIMLGTSNEIISSLVADFDNNYDEVINNLPDFKFNKGSFLSKGSIIDNVNALVDVSGGTVFRKNGVVYLDKQPSIENLNVDHTFTDSMILSKVKSDNWDGSPLVKKIVFNANKADVVANPLITMVYNDDCSRPYFLFNPTPNATDITTNLGAFELTYHNQTYREKISTNSISVSGGIHSISQITLDGLVVDPSDYSFFQDNNAILFTTPQIGNVEVIYSTLALKLYSNNGEYNTTTKETRYKIQYLNQVLDVNTPDCPTDSTVVSSSGNNNSSPAISLQNFSVKLVSGELTRDKEAVFEVIGDLITLAFVSDPEGTRVQLYPHENPFYVHVGDFNEAPLTGISEGDYNFLSTFTTKIEKGIGGIQDSYGFITPYSLPGDPSTVLVDGAPFYFYRYDKGSYNIYHTSSSEINGLTATVTYNAPGRRYTIPPIGATNKLRTIEFYHAGGVETFTYSDSLCVLPTQVLINVAEKIKIAPEIIAGKTVDYLGTSYTIAGDGTIYIAVSTYEKARIDTSALKNGSYIIVDTTNAQ